jgi:hypothetical protein
MHVSTGHIDARTEASTDAESAYTTDSSMSAANPNAPLS